MFASIILISMLHHNTADIAKQQLLAIAMGDITKAYGMTSRQFQEHISINKFNKFINRYEVLKHYNFVKFNNNKTDGNLAYLSGKIEGVDGSKAEIRYQFVKENQHWKIDSINIKKYAQ